jgi:hydrogenase nickel incorporation protein HypA/HybF
MHEFSIARALVTEIRRVVAQQGGGSVMAVNVEVGPLSGIESFQLAQAFRVLTAESELSQAVLQIIQAPLVARCDDCQREFELRDYRFRCPHCGDVNVLIERGDGVIIRTLTLADRSPAEARP